jgi:hypothetical protein
MLPQRYPEDPGKTDGALTFILEDYHNACLITRKNTLRIEASKKSCLNLYSVIFHIITIVLIVEVFTQAWDEQRVSAM